MKIPGHKGPTDCLVTAAAILFLVMIILKLAEAWINLP